MKKTAILIDGGFFVHRYRALYAPDRRFDHRQVARDLYGGALRDLRKANPKRIQRRELYRILFYDCPPLDKRIQNPVSGKGINTGASQEAEFRRNLHEELKRRRKVAIRLGRLSDSNQWVINPKMTKKLVRGDISFEDLKPSDVTYDVRQKGVDMKIGLDIASLAYKRAVDQIILIAGDSDFVPAAKLARREGIDFVLDPMWNHINPDLHEHIDGLVSEWPQPDQATSSTKSGS